MGWWCWGTFEDYPFVVRPLTVGIASTSDLHAHLALEGDLAVQSNYIGAGLVEVTQAASIAGVKNVEISQATERALARWASLGAVGSTMEQALSVCIKVGERNTELGEQVVVCSTRYEERAQYMLRWCTPKLRWVAAMFHKLGLGCVLGYQQASMIDGRRTEKVNELFLRTLVDVWERF
jgi:hypothetical protein